MSDVNRSFPEKLIEQLRNKYLELIINESSSSFFLELAHYLKYIKDTPELNAIIKDCTENEEKEKRKQLIKIVEKFKKQVLAVTSQILLFKNNKNVEMEAISERLNELKYIIKKCVYLNKWFPEYYGTDIFMDLEKVFEFMREGYTLYDDFLDFTNSKYNFNDINISFERLIEERPKYEDLRNTVIWGAWNHLEAFYISVFKENNILENYYKEKNFGILTDDTTKFFPLRGEIEDINYILAGCKEDKEKNLLLKYKTYTKLISNKIFEYNNPLSMQNLKDKKISYDEKNNELNFYGQIIKFRYSSNQSTLLRLIFNNEDGYTDIETRDLLEELGIINVNDNLDKDTLNENRLILYNAGRTINNKIFKITNSDDFLIYSTIKAGINSKYLKDVL